MRPAQHFLATRIWSMASALLVLACSISLASDEKARPRFETIEARIKQHFASKRDYKSGDLLSRRDVEAVLDDLRKLGWDAPDRDEILAAALADDAPLVKRLRTSEGRTLMRQSSKYAGAYDRMDRLERLPDGDRILRRLSQGPDGYKLIEYLATADGGQEMGKMLGKAPRGKNFNQATGRIYTESQLVARLRKSYTADKQRAY